MQLKYNPLAVAWLTVGLLVMPVCATDYYVRVDGHDAHDGLTPATAKRTVQAAIAVAVNGDTVLVSDGTYALAATIEINKGITIRSINGHAATILDGQDEHRCVTLNHPSARLEGFTVRRGLAGEDGYIPNAGGGIQNLHGVVHDCRIVANHGETAGGVLNGPLGLLAYCEISHNSADQSAGGIWNEGVVSNCLVTANHAPTAGGIYNNNDGSVHETMITGNTASFFGAGAVNAGAVMNRCAITGNHLTDIGLASGVYNMDAGIIDSCMVVSNGATAEGLCIQAGGILNAASTVRFSWIAGNQALIGGGILNEAGLVHDCLIEHNQASRAGGVLNGEDALLHACIVRYNSTMTGFGFGDGLAGGIYNETNAVTRNCLVVGNSALYGGGIVNDGRLHNCTAAGNQALFMAGGLANFGETWNSIVWHNSAAQFADFFDDDGDGKTYYSCLPEPTAGVGNITNNPALLNPGSGFGLQHAYGNYRLAAASPCINTAHAIDWMLAPGATDLDGNPRIIYHQPDMGAYEYFAPPAQVTASDGTHADRVAIAWVAADPPPAYYEVWRGITGNPAQADLLAAIEDLSFDDTGAEPGVLYHYWVRPAFGGPGPFSSPDTGWRKILPPADLTASAGTHTDAVHLSWKTAAGAVVYEIYRNTRPDPTGAVKIAVTAESGWTDATVVAGVLHYYWIRAMGVDFQSEFSGPASGWRRSMASTDNAPGDIDGDGLMDLLLYDPQTGAWHLLLSGSGYRSFSLQLGGPGYVPVPGDYNGNGRTDPAVYHEATGAWAIFIMQDGYWRVHTRYFGGTGWQAVPGDYDGDGLTDLAVYHKTNGAWHGLLSGAGYTESVMQLGGAGWQPAPADFDGDGKTDPAVYNEATGNWMIRLSGQAYAAVGKAFGGTGWQPVPADFDGDGRADLAVYHHRTGEWSALLSGYDYTMMQIHLGGPDWWPVAADYDGDGRADIAVYNLATGAWQAMLSGSNYALTRRHFGEPGWRPVINYPGN